MAGRIERLHGRYRLIAAPLRGSYLARAFLKDVQGGPIQAEAQSATAEAALAALGESVDSADAADRTSRRHAEELRFYVPTPREYAQALWVCTAGGKHADALLILRHLAAAGAEGATNAALGRAAGKAEVGYSDLVLGTLGGKVAAFHSLALPAPIWDRQGRTMTSYVLASGRQPTAEGEVTIRIIHPEVAEALTRL